MYVILFFDNIILFYITINDINDHKNGSTPMKAIVIDIDDTVLDFGSRLREFVNHQYDKQVTGKP